MTDTRSLRRHPLVAITLVMSAALASTPVLADDISLGLGGNQQDFELAMQDLQAAFSYKGLAPAEPLGTLGFHAGVIASYTGIENDQAWRNLTGSSFDDLGVVAIAAGKGLPFGIDVGAFIADVPGSNVNLFGAEVRYALAGGGIATPAVGIRASYTKINGLDELDFDTASIDVSVSKGFVFLTPYVGVGRVFSNADPKFAATDPRGLQYSKVDNSDNKFYGGVRISLALFKVTAELDQTGDNTSYNLRLALGF